MKIGFSSLALFMHSLEKCLNIAIEDDFELIEILCEGPYWPRNMLEKSSELEILSSYDIELFLHSPTIDLNPASLNPGIRRETLNQLIETLKMANKIGADAVTTHPGLIHRLESRIRNLGLKYSIETLKAANHHAIDLGVKLCIENMPNRYAYYCNTAEEHEVFVKECDCHATVDMGHANTSTNLQSFLKIPNIAYYHLSDNDGKKDQHLRLGKGKLDLKLLKGLDKVIIELNNYVDVLESKKRLLSLIKNRG